jgi:hypothetical protein
VRNIITMKRIVITLSILLFCIAGNSQKLSHVIFSQGKTLSSYSFTTDQQIIIRISETGQLLEWGTEMESFRMNYTPGKLLPYMGRVDYYGDESADPIFKGKVKSIGTCFISYYPSTEIAAKAGKIQYLGNQLLDYYSHYDNAAFSGKLKLAGNYLLSYYSSFENDAFKGKLKSVDSCPISYFSSFEDNLIRGKIKSIGSVEYAWYTSRDRREFQGGLKSGSLRQTINGITYIVW